ncbi:MAG: ABZJ_00895 family protein [Paraglaciecola sp.]|uniref:ABZJ_00895 family protein n=1 Tax=Paraglaciecola sp. TaxID=1920173 RepID=UPI00326415B6
MKLSAYLKPTAAFTVLYVLAILIIVGINNLFGFQHAALRTTAILSSAIGAAYIFIRVERRLPSMKEAWILSLLSLLVFWAVIDILRRMAGIPFMWMVLIAQIETALVFIGIAYFSATRTFLGGSLLKKPKRD